MQDWNCVASTNFKTSVDFFKYLLLLVLCSLSIVKASKSKILRFFNLLSNCSRRSDALHQPSKFSNKEIQTKNGALAAVRYDIPGVNVPSAGGFDSKVCFDRTTYDYVTARNLCHLI